MSRPKETRVIHLLRFGQAECGKPGPPSKWEENHVWAGVADRKRVNCPACLKTLKKNFR